LEFNQLVMIRSIFQEETVAAFEHCFAPAPPSVGAWLDEVDLSAWRSILQARRLRTDREILSIIGITPPG
jgi:hypothetical protein